jgi:hypothetical protein
MKWRCFARARGVEESKFCFFLVVFPVRCISSVSIIPKLIKELNMRCKTESTRRAHKRMLQDIPLSKNFLDKTPKPQATKNRQMGLQKTKMLLLSKGNNQQIKRQLTEWEQIFANHVCEEGLISIYIRTSNNSIAKTQITPFKNGHYI